MNHNEFKSKLKSLVRRTVPDRVGHWTRFLDSVDPSLEEFIISLCYSFLRGDESKRREIENQMNDKDILWFIQTFIENRSAAIQKPSDTESLLLGLVAVAIIGPNSDPNDVTIWLGDLYLASVIGSVSERKQLYERIGNIAAEKWGLAKQIRLFPERNEKALQREAELKRERPVAHEQDIDDGSGLTPMMRAAMNGNLSVLFDLIQNGEDVNVVTDGASALAFAAFAGQEEAVKLLLNSGARIDVKPHGMSLLEFTNLGDKKPIISDLLKGAGAKRG